MNAFIELSLILVITTLIAGFLRILKQPAVVGYVVSGLVIGPYLLNLSKSTDMLNIFSEMGIAILLFIVGLHLNPTEIKGYGKNILLVGFGQILVTFTIGFVLSMRLGYPLTQALYLGICLTFSSTIIVLKLLSDKQDLEKLYGKIVIAALILQDIVAAVVIVVLGSVFGDVGSTAAIMVLIIKGLLITLIISVFGFYVLPSLSTFFAKSQEFLFLFSLAWGFGIATLFHFLGFSTEIGALVAGVALSVTPYSQEISSRLRSLRDFFVVMFFIVLGAQIDFNSALKSIIPFIIFILFIIFGKPLIVLCFTKISGYNKKTGFLAGISLSQISEFSMILALLGLKLGHLDKDVVSLITLLGVLSIFISAYAINFAERIYPKIARYLVPFEKKETQTELQSIKNADVILFGADRVGYDFIKVFKDMEEDFLVVDFDPDIVKKISGSGIHCMYGDAEDSEFLEDIAVEKAKMIISTIPDFETNNYLLHIIRKNNEKTIVIVLSYVLEEAMQLYEKGATYVIMPHFISGEFAAHLAKSAGFDIRKMHSNRNKHIDYLKERRYLGHSHPKWHHLLG
ncbi:hypothetical protein A3K42_01830 [candidate division WWE3 bacterium RBG_13_37_7]|uniref:RCK N-terminal domain-containing protein n=1 Tax=candidate division WWE3 bacterium RBG_13_37_7 TaxID=1802609 RepID=A0A1F4U0H6_UNCKA|nr:MAG: hypothetical protein A3K42_01830 [candidate division WWE3 bacterium RBG_13_37_7]